MYVFNFQSNISFQAETEEEAGKQLEAYLMDDSFDAFEEYTLENVRELLGFELKGLLNNPPETIKLQTADCCKDCTLNIPEQCLLRVNQQVETCDRYEYSDEEVNHEG
jgi:hypothetical protein